MTKSTLTTRKKSSPKPKTTASKIPPSQHLCETDEVPLPVPFTRNRSKR